jgi:hypothetical protein
MNIKTSLLVAGAVASVGLANVAGTAPASAASPSSFEGLASKIAAKFDLDKDEVMEVFEQNGVDETEKQQKSEQKPIKVVKATQRITYDGKSPVKYTAKPTIVKKKAEKKRVTSTMAPAKVVKITNMRHTHHKNKHKHQFIFDRKHGKDKKWKKADDTRMKHSEFDRNFFKNVMNER